MDQWPICMYIYISYIELKYDSKAYHLPPIVAPIHLCNCHNSMAEKPDSILIETRTKFKRIEPLQFCWLATKPAVSDWIWSTKLSPVETPKHSAHGRPKQGCINPQPSISRTYLTHLKPLVTDTNKDTCCYTSHVMIFIQCTSSSSLMEGTCLNPPANILNSREKMELSKEKHHLSWHLGTTAVGIIKNYLHTS